MAKVPFKGTWRVKVTQGLAQEVLPEPLGLYPYVKVMDWATSNPRIETIAPEYQWQIDDSCSDDLVVRGTINLPDERGPRFGFVIYHWYGTENGKQRVRGVIYRLVRPGDEIGTETGDPGTWEAEEEGDGGEDQKPSECGA